MVIGEKIGAKTAEKYSFVFTFSFIRKCVWFLTEISECIIFCKSVKKYLTMWMSSLLLKYSLFEFSAFKNR